MAEGKVTAFKLDSSGMQELLNEGFVADCLLDVAGPVADAANAGAGGEFTYHIEEGRTDRVRVAVGSDDEGVLFYESATGNLLRALDAGKAAI